MPQYLTLLTAILTTLFFLSCTGPQHISFPTQDGGIVHADLYGKTNPTQNLVLAHGAIFNKESWATQAQEFADAGFRIVVINFRGRGESKGNPAAKSPNEGVHFDVLAAVQYLRENGAESVAVVGASFGGWASANAAAQAPGTINRLVLLAAPADQPEKLTGRKLFILSREDTTGNGTPRLPAIQAQFERTPEPKELIILEGAAHAQFIFETDQSDRLMQEILRFLTKP